MTMREKIARAICAELDPSSPFEDECEENRHYYLKIADAILDAMRDPLDDMARSGRDKIILQSNYTYYPASHEIADVWRTMIDAAKEQPK